mgnify:FL=1
MTPSPASPIPTASFSVTGNVTNISPPSGDMGVSSTASGPWFIERQWMDISYERVPSVSREILGDNDISLSAVDPVSGTFLQTAFIVNISARYNVEKSYDYYASGYQEPQKFTAFPVSADYHGDVYGILDATSGTLGPRGNILTTQKWYARRLWVSGVDSVVDQQVSGAFNFAFDSSAASNMTAPPAKNALECFANYGVWLGENGSASFSWGDLDEVADVIMWRSPDYTLPGSYSVNQETNAGAMLIALLDSWGARLGYLGALFDVWGRPSLGLPGYSISRHNYS